MLAHRLQFAVPTIGTHELRKQQTPAELKRWLDYLKGLPFRVRRQCPLDRFIVDFYIHNHQLVIEVDGESHAAEQAQRYDLERTKVLEGMGLRVVRFTNNEVLLNFGGVCEHLNTLFR